jgi:hypothetical protein
MKQIGVIGPEKADKNQLEIAEKLGEDIAKRGYVLITGGAGGVMEAASRGAKNYGGITVGTPGKKRLMSNRYVDIEICTPVDIGDFIFAGILSCDLMLVIPGDAGTSAEFFMGIRNKIPMVVINAKPEMASFVDDKVVFAVKNAEEAIKKMEEAIKND